MDARVVGFQGSAWLGVCWGFLVVDGTPCQHSDCLPDVAAAWWVWLDHISHADDHLLPVLLALC